MHTSFRGLLAWTAMLAVVLGTGAIAQAQSDRIERRVVQFKLDDLKDDGKAAGIAVELVPTKTAEEKRGDTQAQDQQVREAIDGLIVRAAEAAPGFWIGLQLEPAGDALRAQLNLNPGQGLVVESVVPDGPAAKAGFKQFDVVTTVDGKMVSGVEAFNKIVADVKDTRELSVLIYRTGKDEELKVRPAKRPASDAQIRFAPEAMRIWEQYIPGAPHDDAHRLALTEPMRVEMFHPGFVLPEGNIADLPKNVSISISKTGGEPAKIVVKKENTTWEVTDKELDKLPADVRPHVEGMLRGRPHALTVARGAASKSPYILSRPVPTSPPKADVLIPRRVPDDVEKRLEDMNRRLEAMQKTLEEIAKGQK